MVDRLKILFVDDEPTDVLLAQHELERDGLLFASHTVCREIELRVALIDFAPDIVLCDYTLPGFSGLRALDIVHRFQPSIPVLMISGSVSEDTAIECLARGAIDYLLKSNLRRLGPAVRRAVCDTRERQALTGLPNLTHVNDLVCRLIERAPQGHPHAAVVVLNLDQFRFIDEGFGRRMADEVLRDISAALKAEAREHDAVARVGPDEFLLVLSDIDAAVEASTLVQGLLAVVARPRRVASEEVRITASAGIALYPSDGADFETLLRKATEAMHEAKTTSQGGWQFHSSEVVRHAHEQRQLATGLRNAIQRNELCLHFQPQFDIRSGRACGVEALARWFRPDANTVAPSVFIPLAEQSGLIWALGSWALEASCKAAAGWANGIETLPTLCVNVSTHQIRQEFTSVIAEALDVSGWPAEHLELEITESVLIENADATLDCLAQWKRLGVRIAVDDFGTGYSSLSYLSRLPVDRLKMDRSLIQGMTRQSKSAAIVRAVVSLGRELGFTVLAEGVETEEQLHMLELLGCEQAQGFLMTPPLPAAEARALMRRKWGARQLAPRTRGARQRSNTYVSAGLNGRHGP
jgi:diguanylate cyclase (GGDEF)-like protein